MRHVARWLPVLLAIWILGCSQDKPAPVQSDSNDPEQISQATKQMLDANSIDDLGNLTDPKNQDLFVVEPTVFDTNYDVYAVTFLWGHLANTQPNIESITNWTGGISINGVAVIKPVALIAFEPNQDKLIPTDIPSTLAWESFTSGDFDGITMLVFVDRRIVYAVAPQLTFGTPPFTKSWYLEELANLYGYFQVSNINAVAVKAIRLKRIVCGFGTFVGKWTRVPSTAASIVDTGFFEGMWYDRNSEPYGIMSGIWWDSPTDNVLGGEFEGQLSGVITDQIIAHLRGRWMYDDPRMCPLCGSGHGRLIGSIKATNGDYMGQMMGEFSAMDIPTPLEYTLTGKWYERCSPWNPANSGK